MAGPVDIEESSVASHSQDPPGPPGTTADEGEAPRWTVSSVARRLGVAPATLRTWARRYGLGPTGHVSGAHRRYTADDLARLQHMRRLTQEGVAPADAARLALAGDVRPATGIEPAPTRPGGGSGGRVLALPTAGPATRGLARAAMALDDQSVVETLREALRRDGVVQTWETTLAPVLVAVGQRWAATGEGVDVEHLLAESATTVLREAVVTRGLARGARFALLACADGDRHALPLHVLAAALAERGVPTRVLGASVPAAALASAVRRTGPAAVFLWSQLRDTASPETVEALPTTRPAAAVVLGGPGWRRHDVPPRSALARDLAEAVDLVAGATGR